MALWHGVKGFLSEIRIIYDGISIIHAGIASFGSDECARICMYFLFWFPVNFYFGLIMIWQ